MYHHDPFRAPSAADDTPQAVEPEHNDHLNSMRLPDLRALAESLGLDNTGKRHDLIDRVRAHQTSGA